MLHPVLAEAFETLLMTWRLCDDLAKNQAPYHKRLSARFKLEDARDQLGRYRRALNPEQRELEEVAFTSYCPSLDASVFVSHFERARAQDSTCVCVCGSRVEVPNLDSRHSQSVTTPANSEAAN